MSQDTIKLSHNEKNGIYGLLYYSEGKIKWTAMSSENASISIISDKGLNISNLPLNGEFYIDNPERTEYSLIIEDNESKHIESIAVDSLNITAIPLYCFTADKLHLPDGGGKVKLRWCVRGELSKKVHISCLGFVEPVGEQEIEIKETTSLNINIDWENLKKIMSQK